MKTEMNDDCSLNVEGVTEEEIKSITNFLKGEILEMKVKIISINVAEEVIVESDSMKQFIEEDDEDTSSI